MSPDFKQPTKRILAERAGYRCSNPDCRTPTVGPNSDHSKSTKIGEAAHIYGAREGAKRYKANMSNDSRAELTNGIWLCKNCHKKIDTDEVLYTPDLLFRWRELHEKYVLLELGSRSDRISLEIQEEKLANFNKFPEMVRRLVRDEPNGWEWKLAAEILEHLNTPHFQKLKDLREGAYVRPLYVVRRGEEFRWFSLKLKENEELVKPFEVLMKRLSNSWNSPNEEDCKHKILHVCNLVSDYLSQVIRHEEELTFVFLDDEFSKLLQLQRGLVSSQVEKLKSIPELLNEVIAMVEQEHNGDEPKVIQHTIAFDMPNNWSDEYNEELRRLHSLGLFKHY